MTAAQKAGSKGGLARAARLSAERRSEIARQGNAAMRNKKRKRQQSVLDLVSKHQTDQYLSTEEFDSL